MYCVVRHFIIVMFIVSSAFVQSQDLYFLNEKKCAKQLEKDLNVMLCRNTSQVDVGQRATLLRVSMMKYLFYPLVSWVLYKSKLTDEAKQYLIEDMKENMFDDGHYMHMTRDLAFDLLRPLAHFSSGYGNDQVRQLMIVMFGKKHILRFNHVFMKGDQEQVNVYVVSSTVGEVHSAEKHAKLVAQWKPKDIKSKGGCKPLMPKSVTVVHEQKYHV